MNRSITRREFIRVAGATATVLAGAGTLGTEDEPRTDESAADLGTHIYKSLKWDMVRVEGSVLERMNRVLGKSDGKPRGR